MALINCPECGKQISDRAKTCIFCGYPIQEYMEEQKQKEQEKKKDIPIRDDICPKCGNEISPVFRVCRKCGYNENDSNAVVRTDEKASVIPEKYEPPKYDELQPSSKEDIEPEREFHGIYKYTLFGVKEVYCPRCGSENCSYYQQQRIIPGKTKTRYTANLNPLHPFTLVNKKEKVKRKEEIVTEKMIICNKCGLIFK